MVISKPHPALSWCTRSLMILAVAALLPACKPEGFINKVKYNGEKYTNTCQSFTDAVNKVVKSNTGPLNLRVSEYDNSDFTYYYLEPGQFEIKGDTLYFRLSQDIEYGQYLAKGVSIHVNASCKPVDNLADLEGSATTDLGKLVINAAYYAQNRKPFFLYKIPLSGKSLDGKQLMLSFAIAQYDKTGALKKYFCQTDVTPVGTAMPACCTAQPWQTAMLRSIVDLPKLNVKEEKYVYEGFTGHMDVMFKEGSAKVSDDSSFSASLIQAYVDKYKGLNYRLTYLDLSGYASPGGKETSNISLSQQRADIVREGLKALNEGNDLRITSEGKGEDWERVKLLTMATDKLTPEQKTQVLAICNDAALSNDQREASLRKLKYWTTLVDEVLVKARHTFTVMDFAYKGSLPTIGRFTDRLPVASLQLEQVAKTEIKVQPYQASPSADAQLATLEDVLTKKASPNLYAMRATYFLAQKEYNKAFEDLEKASRFRDGQSAQYMLAIQGYKVLFADTYTFEEKKQLYTDLTAQGGTDRSIQFNRTILMDKIGYISGALSSYSQLLDGQPATAAQLNNRGVARAKTNRVSEAMLDFNAALAQSQLAEAYYNLAILTAWKGYTRSTAEYLEKAVAIDPAYKAFIFGNPAFKIVSEDPRFDKFR
ncbi:MAG: hypothetical protein SF053_05945 [Bacteroidia bacterium]|nr:hypothetical protein [Bacteroidia bacterium]